MNEKITTIQGTERLLKAMEVASILNISKSMAYRLMKQGEIPVIYINQSVRVHPKDLENFIQENRVREELFSLSE